MYKRQAHYISDIRESSRLLQVDWNERQMVDTILVGLSPEERSRLALINRPNTFADLEQCSIHSSNVWYSDQNRHAMKSTEANRNELQALVPDVTTQRERRVFNRPHNLHSPGKSNETQPKTEARYPPRNKNMCYNCGKYGHISRNCNNKQYERKHPNPKYM